MKNKYLKKSRNREKLTNCLQRRADETIRELATKRNDTKIIAVTSNDLVAKEACYHFTCYREYTRPIKPTSTHNHDVTDDGTSEVIKFLVGLHEKPDIVEFRKLQNMVTTESGKKNLKRNIEAKTKCLGLRDRAILKCQISTTRHILIPFCPCYLMEM